MSQTENKEKEIEIQSELLEGVGLLDVNTRVTVQNLLTVKSVVTILLTVIFAYLAVVGRISGEQFLTIFSVVIAFYFGTQYQKGKGGDEE